MSQPNLKPLFKSLNLTKRQKYCVAVSALYAVGLRNHGNTVLEKAIRRDRIPPHLFSELFIHLSLFLGFPTMLEGLERLKTISGSKITASKSRISLGSSGNGMKIFREIYGDQAKKVLLNLKGLHSDMIRWVIRDAYGKIFTRGGMSLGERELVNVVVLAIQGFAPQLFSHLRGALRVGISSRGIIDTLNCIASCSRTEQRASLRMLGQITRMRRTEKRSIDSQR